MRSNLMIVAQEMGGTWLRIFSELSETIRTGEPQCHRVFGMGWWDWLNANPAELDNMATHAFNRGGRALPEDHGKPNE